MSSRDIEHYNPRLNQRNTQLQPAPAMLYEFLFKFFDSIPTWSFFLYFLVFYLCLHLAAYQLLVLSAQFSQSDLARRSYILCAVLEAGLLAFIR